MMQLKLIHTSVYDESRLLKGFTNSYFQIQNEFFQDLKSCCVICVEKIVVEFCHLMCFILHSPSSLNCIS